MNILSVNVSLPKTAVYQNKPFETGIFKQPVAGPVPIIGNNLEGDRQADLKHHGGESKAIYAYSHDHYADWQKTLGLDEAIPFGQFGENLTVSGLDEMTSYVGDHWRVGDALLAITQPRIPCFKLGVIFNNPQMVKLFMDSGLAGVYLKVLEAGSITAGDTIEVVKQGKGAVAIKPLFEAFFNPEREGAVKLLARALEVEELAPEWRIPIAKLVHN